MKILLHGGASALAFGVALFGYVAPAFAQEQTHIETNDYADTITVEASRPDGHGPAGMMGDHTHEKGGLMIGLSLMHDDYRGTNRLGNDKISDDAIFAAGYSGRTQSMTMDMAMLHIMYAPSDRLTLMVMPSWQRMEMVMIGTGTTAAPGHGGHHALEKGETMSHSTEGFGDTQVSALVTLSKSKSHQLHAGMGVSIPTGSVSRKDDDGNFVHYGMQSGSGTWDLLPQITYRGWKGAWGWGSQANYVFRAEDKNKSGFRFGDRFTATAWGSYALSSKFSLSGRLGYQTEGKVEGHYNAGHNHAAPPDRQANYGGERIDAGLGANMLLGRMRFGAEATLPLYQNVNGIQAPKRFGAAFNVTTMF